MKDPEQILELILHLERLCLQESLLAILHQILEKDEHFKRIPVQMEECIC